MAKLRLRRKPPKLVRPILDEVATGARLAEGPEGVRLILRTVFLEGSLPIRSLAQQVGLPVPVVAAVRGELEKLGMLTRRGGVALSEDGERLVSETLGLSSRRQFLRPNFPDLPEDLKDLCGQMALICDRRPKVEVRLDQSHATPETALRRAVYLYEHDALEGRDVLILGDDDLTSLAVGLLANYLEFRTRRLVVLEFDRRLVDFLKRLGKEMGHGLEVVAHDLREEVPAEWVEQFDVFLTDPPYTLEGLNLFVSRGITGLREEVGKQGFICFGRRTPTETAEAIRSLTDMGLAPLEMLPNFNAYVGAQVLGGVSQMIRTVTTSAPKPAIVGTYTGDLYTADLKRSRRRDGR
ncbi:MAG: bis-aminopropyl spermidine synthase family protein [bacterium]|nr:bis-aminopropyl spermidine synthase family protein [bacterium]